jgi:hypothetical protein
LYDGAQVDAPVRVTVPVVAAVAVEQPVASAMERMVPVLGATQPRQLQVVASFLAERPQLVSAVPVGAVSQVPSNN